MSTCRPITIVGGGLAGLTLGVALRQRDVPVIIWEAGHYPRHRVCGEFISGRGQDVLERFGLKRTFEQAGAIFSRTAQFHLGKASSPVRSLDPPALCLSRFEMDRLLAQSFSESGGELRLNSRWTGDTTDEGLVFANGRRIRPVENGCRWFGIKAHARQVQLDADLEMHGSVDSYVGLCRLPGDEVNVCGLFRARAGAAASGTRNIEPPHPTNGRLSKDILRGSPGTLLYERLAHAVFEEASFCSVAGLPLRPQHAVGQPTCRLGDALTMIPPVTGNGMSMAFESAALAVEPLCAYAHGKLNWQAAQSTIARDCDAAFRCRLFWARLLQALMLSKAVQGRLGSQVLHSNILWRLLFSRTR